MPARRQHLCPTPSDRAHLALSAFRRAVLAAATGRQRAKLRAAFEDAMHRGHGAALRILCRDAQAVFTPAEWSALIEIALLSPHVTPATLTTLRACGLSLQSGALTALARAYVLGFDEVRPLLSGAAEFCLVRLRGRRGLTFLLLRPFDSRSHLPRLWALSPQRFRALQQAGLELAAPAMLHAALAALPAA